MESRKQDRKGLPTRSITLAFGTLLLSALGATANAVPLLDIVPTAGPWGGPDTVPLGGSHDVAATSGQSGWYNANLVALQNVNLVFTYYGKEAGWTNEVSVGGSTVFNTGTSSAGDTANGGSALAGSLIDFVISVVAGGNAGTSVTNGSNVAPIGVASGIGSYGAPNFWLGYVDASHQSVWVAFDDGGGYWGGSIDDDDHDDAVFKITAVPVRVPEPGTLSLLGAGLLLTGFIGYRRKESAATT